VIITDRLEGIEDFFKEPPIYIGFM
jgi:hypothetical protein